MFYNISMRDEINRDDLSEEDNTTSTRNIRNETIDSIIEEHSESLRKTLGLSLALVSKEELKEFIYNLYLGFIYFSRGNY